MAGEWIKLTTNLHTKPEVFKLARMLSVSVDTTIGLLVRFWCWVDLVTVDGVVDGVEASDVDAVVGYAGFHDALVSVGWAKRRAGSDGIEIPNFARHNGETAKKRGLKNERQARWRASKVDDPASTKAPTREEKRREDITPIVPKGTSRRCSPEETQGFIAFWSSWPQSKRKSDRFKCFEVWRREGLESITAEITAHVEAMKRHPQWREGFEPAPLRYLRNRRWTDPIASGEGLPQELVA